MEEFSGLRDMDQLELGTDMLGQPTFPKRYLLLTKSEYFSKDSVNLFFKNI